MTKKKKRSVAESAKPHRSHTAGYDAPDDFLKVPRSFLYAGRQLEQDHTLTDSRLRMLLLALWARAYKDKPIRAYWEELGRDLGVSKNTVRNWAYRLEKGGWIRIIRHKGRQRDPKTGQVGWRDARNTFDLRPFWKFLRHNLEPERQSQRRARKGSRHKNETPEEGS